MISQFKKTFFCSKLVIIVNFLLNDCLYCCHLSADMLHQIYPELLKRMDDSSDEIRIVVTRTFLAYFK